MARLIAKTPCDGLLPVEIGELTLAERDPGHLTALSPMKGGHERADRALKAAIGTGFPAPGQSAKGREGARVLWFGVSHALVMGPKVEAVDGAALTDQSDGWCVIELKGPGARDVLARLTPIDLRPNAFAKDATARTLLGHMSASITRTGDDAYLILVYRSMAGTAVEEITRAMRLWQARKALG